MHAGSFRSTGRSLAIGVSLSLAVMAVVARVAADVTFTKSDAASFERRYPVSKAVILAPAVEYNFNAQVGVIVGARIVPAGRNTTASVTPAIAVNWVR